jgi:hypothetical protein
VVPLRIALLAESPAQEAAIKERIAGATSE